MPANPQTPSTPGGAQPQQVPNGGLLAAMFPPTGGGTANPAQPSTEPAQPVAGAPQPNTPAVGTEAPAQPVTAAPETPVVEGEDDIEPEIDPAEAGNTAVLKSYQGALKKANREAQTLRTVKKQLEAQVAQLSTTNQALQAQVVPTKRELSFYRAIHEQSNQNNGALRSVLYPALLWQAIQPHLQWNGDQPTNLEKALADARATYPALFQVLPPANGGEGMGQEAAGGFNMNSFIRGAIKGSGRVQNG